MVRIGITGLGSYLPKTIISNEDLIKSGIDTEEAWILKRTGIKTRRISTEYESLPIMMSIAALRALKDANLSPLNLDYIIAGTNSTDPLLVPQIASRVQFLIGADNIPSFDVQAGCTGAIYAKEIGARIVRDIYNNELSLEGKPKRAKVLILGGDTLSNLLEMKDRRSSVILSDGAGAAILEPTYCDDEGIRYIFNKADGAKGNLIHYESGFHPLSFIPKLEERFTLPGHFLMDGKNVHRFILEISSEAIRNLIEKAGLPLESLSNTTIIPHQMNLRSIESFVEGLEKNLGFRPKHVYTDGIINYGNNSTASTLIGLDETYRQQKLDLYDPTIVVAFGAGLTWGGYLTMWNKPKPETPLNYNLAEQKMQLEELNKKYDEWKSRLAK